MAPRIIALLAALVLAPLRAGAQDASAVAEARERFDRGIRLFDGESYEAALAEFLRAYEVAPNHVVLLNIAHTCRRLGRNAQAVDAFERYLAEGGDAVQAQRRAEVERELHDLRPMVGGIRVVVSRPDAAVVSIDGIEVGAAPLDRPVRVDAGRHVVEVNAEDHLPSRREVTVAGQAEALVEVSLTPVPAPAPAPVPAPAPAPAPEQPDVVPTLTPDPEAEAIAHRRRSMRIASWVMAGLSVAALGTALAFSLSARSEYARWEEADGELAERYLLADDPQDQLLEEDWAEHERDLEAIQTSETLALVMLGVGVATAATWAGLFFGAPREPAAEARVSLVPSPRGLLLSLSGPLP